MDDLISRQAATQTALEFIVEYLGGAFDEDFQRKLIERMNALPSAQPEQRWIPCSERLPENDNDVLVQMNDESMMVDYRAASSNGWFWAELGDEPVAWMPLPEPYKGGEQDG